jgi:hypothetical protein
MLRGAVFAAGRVFTPPSRWRLAADHSHTAVPYSTGRQESRFD